MPELDPWTDRKLSGYVEEQIAATEQVRTLGSQMPPAGTVPAEKIRKFRLYNKDGSLKPRLVDWAEDVTIDVKNRSVLTRQFSPDNFQGLYLHFHGGGWALGSVYEQDVLLAKIARETNKKVITIDYPLTPAHTLPEILDVAFGAVTALIDAHPGARICIGGESAGAHVAACCVIGLKSSPEHLSRVDAVNLSYGLYDLSMTPSQRNWGEEFLGLSTPTLEWFFDMAMPGLSSEERRASSLSPLFADLSDLPPTIFSVGELDPLIDDTLFMSMRWRAAGNMSVLKIYPQAAHGFNGLPTEMARACNSTINSFLCDPKREQT